MNLPLLIRSLTETASAHQSQPQCEKALRLVNSRLVEVPQATRGIAVHIPLPLRTFSEMRGSERGTLLPAKHVVYLGAMVTPQMGKARIYQSQ